MATTHVRQSLSLPTRIAFLTPAMALLLGLTACSAGDKASDLTAPRNQLLKEDRSATGGDDQLGGGVNAYLWRGALDTLSFMPISTADAVGGFILTDWYTPPAAHGERFKITAYVLDKRLRSDALRVSVFRQVREGDEWADVPPAANTSSDITSKILARARQLRADNGNNDN
ncbi:DUF3576 domain-containing protein [Acetobacter sp.]|jgi:hypothetical protein|uniref:DUF3576 domain-containing protein n=1 Tax=Acetobacter sp. TaxID=440 RepID=UPI00387E45E5